MKVLNPKENHQENQFNGSKIPKKENLKIVSVKMMMKFFPMVKRMSQKKTIMIVTPPPVVAVFPPMRKRQPEIVPTASQPLTVIRKLRKKVTVKVV